MDEENIYIYFTDAIRMIPGMNRPLGLTQVLPEKDIQIRQDLGIELQISWVITAGSLSCTSNVEELVSECSDAVVCVSVYLGLGLLLCRPVFNPGLLTQVVPQSKEKTHTMCSTLKS